MSRQLVLIPEKMIATINWLQTCGFKLTIKVNKYKYV